MNIQITDISSQLKSLDDIIPVNRQPEVTVYDYGKYVHLISEFCNLSGLTIASRDKIIQQPWTGAEVRRIIYTRTGRRQGRSHRAADIYADVKDETVPLSLEEFQAFDLGGHIDGSVVRIIDGTVQDIVACPRTNDGVTEMTLHCCHMHTEPDPQESDRRMTVIFERWIPRVINSLDLEMILRAKISECLVLSLQTVCQLLDPSVPTLLIPGLRTEQDIVEWSSSFQAQRLPALRTRCPSDIWSDEGREYSSPRSNRVVLRTRSYQ